MNWYYAERGQQTGPVSEAQLGDLLRKGTISPDTLVWRDGLPGWVPYRQIMGDASAPVSSSPMDPPTGPEAVCSQCGKMFPIEETIRHGEGRFCANCKPIFLQKLREGASVNKTGGLNYAGFWIRFAAKLVDGLILGIPFALIYFPIIMSQIRNARGPQFSFLPLLLQVCFMFIQTAYQIFFLGKYGATPGKMACRLKVVNSDGSPIGYGRATGRFFAEMLSGLICYIGYIIVAFDNPQKRALHDHICNTRVILK